ncbi:hypothetical protein ABZP36_026178 [Zizania latifolia]
MMMRNGMATSILLFVLAGALALATAHGEVNVHTTTEYDDSNILLLPGEGEVGRPGPSSRPWECCEDYEMSPLKIFPPLYRCNDVVKRCANACEKCVSVGGRRGPFVCADWYPTTDPGPFCTERPWGKCCDLTVCTRARIPTCRCLDKVTQCAAACNDCQRVKLSSRPPLFVCQDQFTGLPGPQCTPDTHNLN